MGWELHKLQNIKFNRWKYELKFSSEEEQKMSGECILVVSCQVSTSILCYISHVYTQYWNAKMDSFRISKKGPNVYMDLFAVKLLSWYFLAMYLSDKISVSLMMVNERWSGSFFREKWIGLMTFLICFSFCKIGANDPAENRVNLRFLTRWASLFFWSPVSHDP